MLNHSVLTKAQNMKFWRTFCVALIYSGYVVSLEIPIIPFGQSISRLPENPSPTRERSRPMLPINPITRNANNNNAFPPVIWDLATNSYPVDFFLYTKDNPYLAEVLTVNNASDSLYFDGEKPTKFIIHDFMQSSETRGIHGIKDAYMNKKENVNVILVDWEPARTYTYTVATTVTEFVGKQAARIMQSMKMDPTKVHLVGFGLGAHAAGVMGNDLKQQFNISVARITGLDPSLPLFRMAGSYFKLDPEDATFVDVIHTDGGDNLWNSNHLGMGQECGHIDIYPNRGIFQPGCRQSSLPSYDALHCSHRRALEIYRESIEDEMSFVACRCPTWKDFMESQCDCRNETNRIFVGEACSTAARRGNYYLVTEEAPPYGLGGKGTLPVLTRATDPGIAVPNLLSINGGGLIQGIGQLAAIFTAPVKPFLNSLVRNSQLLSGNSNNNGFLPNFGQNENDGGSNGNNADLEDSNVNFNNDANIELDEPITNIRVPDNRNANNFSSGFQNFVTDYMNSLPNPPSVQFDPPIEIRKDDGERVQKKRQLENQKFRMYIRN